MPGSEPHIVIVGAGFGGLTLARELQQQARERPLRVTLIDRRNHHTFQPLLYQVATSGLQPQDVGHPLRTIFRPRRRHRPVDVRLGEVTSIDREEQVVHLADGATVAWDHLVVAAGAVTNDFDLPGVSEHGFTLKSLPEALALRDHILQVFEDVHAGAVDANAALTFVIAGGGPTGVELAGAVAELVQHVLGKDHAWLDVGRVRVVLVEATDRLLGSFHPRSSEQAREALADRGVEVRLDAGLARAESDRVVLTDGEVIATSTLIWVAGVKASPLAGTLGMTTSGGRVAVTPTLQLPDDSSVSVIGDSAGCLDADGALLPQLAPVAIQQGRWLGRNLPTILDGDVPAKPFRYWDKGTMATIGRADAVAELPFPPVRLSGIVAWVSWLVLHLYFLVGFRNRIAVGLSWAWNWFTFDRSSRLILRDNDRTEHDEAMRLSA